ncbi:MAG: efflux RND transporter periplasmic adaptor subunit [Bacteroidetes bacterium]|nr:efflux RND transporter periplasmic adaptor subunit [Bacteroidota bacterium]
MKYNIIFLTSLLFVISCTNNEQKSDNAAANAANESIVSLTEAQLKNAGIALGKPELGNISTTLKVNGLVDVPPQNMVSVSFPLGGYLKSTHLLPGMKVSKGQIIAVMEDQALIQLQQDFLVAKSKTFFLQKEYERQKALNETKTASDKVFEQVASEYEVEKVVLNSLKEKLLMIGLNPATLDENKISRSINIYAPINGYVSSVKVNIGKYVNPSEILFELVNPEDLHLALKVFEKDLPYIKIGQKIKAHLVNDTSKTYDAEVILISQNLDADRSAMVHCHFENNTHNLLPGMFLNAAIVLEQAASVLVPEEAVVRFGDKQYIFLQRGSNHFEMKAVQTGTTANGVTAIVTDLPNITTTSIVVKNAYAVLMKMQNKEE